MQTSVLVRRHIFSVPADVIFTTRDLLSYGSRAAIDQTIYRYVKARIIVRLARGVFVRPGSKVACDFVVQETRPGEFPVVKKVHLVLDIASAKAKAFGKEIVKHGTEIAFELGLIKKEQKQEGGEDADTYQYFVNGRSSLFKIGKIKVKLIGTSARKIELTKHEIGRRVLALWTLGKTDCGDDYLCELGRTFTRKDRESIRSIARLVPQWLSRFWITCEYNYISLPRLARAPG